MGNVTVGRYADSSSGYKGWIEPDDRTWIMFIRENGVPEAYLDRDSVAGAVI